MTKQSKKDDDNDDDVNKEGWVFTNHLIDNLSLQAYHLGIPHYQFSRAIGTYWYHQKNNQSDLKGKIKAQYKYK